jgi:GNAT superfamily N-acetyltransferase
MMIKNLSVRLVNPNDYNQWLPLWIGYNSFYGRSGSTALDPAITRVTWDRFFDETEPVNALVAEREGILVGISHYIFHRSTTSIKPVCYLQDLFTSAEVRGKGIGRALINGVFTQAIQAGSTRVYWMTHETNETAMKLYNQVAERSGFLVYRKMFW